MFPLIVPVYPMSQDPMLFGMPAAKSVPTSKAEDPLRGLVLRMGERDEKALASLYDAAVSAIYALAMRIVRDPHLAEEIAEDTFFQAWREAQRYDVGRGRVMTWLMMICRSRALDALRRVDIAELSEDPDALREFERSESAEPDAVLSAFRTNTAVHTALMTLTAIERQAVSLSFFRGLTHQEIADLWQMPLGSVKTVMNRAFVQLRAHCAPLWNEMNEH